MRDITVIGGGLAGLTAAIAAAEGGARVRLLEAHGALGGRARSTEGAYKANLGPHPAPHRACDLGGRTEQMGAPGNVGEGLIDGDPLDQRGEITEHVERSVA